MWFMFRLVVPIALFITGAYTITTVARLFFQWRGGHAGGPEGRALQERLARLEATVESLSAETQRVVDGQRFFTQLLANRPPAIGHDIGRDAGQNAGRLPAGTNNVSPR